MTPARKRMFLSVMPNVYLAKAVKPVDMPMPIPLIRMNIRNSRSTLSCLRWRKVQKRFAIQEKMVATEAPTNLALASLSVIGPCMRKKVRPLSMTNATPPTAPNLATSRQKSEASPRNRSANVLINDPPWPLRTLGP